MPSKREIEPDLTDSASQATTDEETSSKSEADPSDGENEVDHASSDSDDLELNGTGPRKRRRTSSVNGENGPEDDAPSGDLGRPSALSLQPISRIKAKTDVRTNGSTTDAVFPTPAASDSLPASIQAAIEVNESATFASLGVDPWLLASLASLSIKRPTKIQKACIPASLAEKNVLGSSATGSGKTVAFAIPILQSWARDPTGIYAVVLTPTRELALQIYEQFSAIGASQSLKCVLVTGGGDMRDQAIALGRRPHIVVATPGRLAAHIDQSGDDTVKGLKRVKYVVLDEADRLLASGKGSMIEDLGICLSALPPKEKRITGMFTATVTNEVRTALESAKNTKGGREVFVAEIDTTSQPTNGTTINGSDNTNSDVLTLPSTLSQCYQLVNVLHKEKYLHILLLTPANLSKSVIIFVNRTATATLLEYLLRSLDHRVTSLHSGLQHNDRVNNLARFRASAARILVATDVAARGLDIPAVGLVINYDLPRDPADYVHRVGRTARAGRKGTAISMVGQRDVELVHAIEAKVGQQMEAYVEDGVNVETRIVREALNVVGIKKREAMLSIEEGRDVKGKRKRGLKRQ